MYTIEYAQDGVTKYYELDLSFISGQSDPGEAKYDLVRAYGSRVWERVGDGLPDPVPFILEGEINGSLDTINAVATELKIAVANATKLWFAGRYLALNGGLVYFSRIDLFTRKAKISLYPINDTWYTQFGEEAIV